MTRIPVSGSVLGNGVAMPAGEDLGLSAQVVSSPVDDESIGGDAVSEIQDEWEPHLTEMMRDPEFKTAYEAAKSETPTLSGYERPRHHAENWCEHHNLKGWCVQHGKCKETFPTEDRGEGDV